MAWKVEIEPAAERELDKLDQQNARRILLFLGPSQKTENKAR